MLHNLCSMSYATIFIFSETIGNACDSYATCKNTDGTYACECVDGFYSSGKTCMNINECEGHRHQCHINAQAGFHYII